MVVPRGRSIFVSWPNTFEMGKKNPGTDRQSVFSFLEQVKNATEMKIDSWHIIMRMRAPKEGSCDPIGPLELPHSLHAFHRISQTDKLGMVAGGDGTAGWLLGVISDLKLPHPPPVATVPLGTGNNLPFSFGWDGYHTFRGGFWNYFSMGMDAQVSYAFHSERKLHPEKFRNQLINQGTYIKLGCTQGWMFGSLFRQSPTNIAQIAKVKVMRKQGQWEDLKIPRSIGSIVCLNLPSFSGGFNPWGTPYRKKFLDRGLTPPFVDDGLIEIVGFRNVLHGLVLLAPNGHGTRLAQANAVRFEFKKGAANHTFMRIDGEPWKQPLPADDEMVVVEISHFGQVSMLATPLCRSRSMHDPSSPTACYNEDNNSSDEGDSPDDLEEKRKFGAADSFKFPDEFDISYLS
ncbi:hypothetical protein GOBAR_DD34424 [Gossypium barbadense]|nr:hypothetical protein GOBAR_DD34424 [Gossypium barbadense]